MYFDSWRTNDFGGWRPSGPFPRFPLHHIPCPAVRIRRAPWFIDQPPIPRFFNPDVPPFVPSHFVARSPRSIPKRPLPFYYRALKPTKKLKTSNNNSSTGEQANDNSCCKMTGTEESKANSDGIEVEQNKTDAVTFDPNLPEALRELFKNDMCELCSVELTSKVQAKNHYEGKPHAKRVKLYLIELKNNKGFPLSSLPASNRPKKRTRANPVDPGKLYCKCCDLSFTSEEHAKQHYLGRNHQRVLHGLKPLKTGYYNRATKKWQRLPVDDRINVALLDSELPGVSEDGSETVFDPESVKERGRFYCELCCVAATSQDQLKGHLVGARHLKMERQSQRADAAVGESGSRPEQQKPRGRARKHMFRKRYFFKKRQKFGSAPPGAAGEEDKEALLVIASQNV